ncbi:MAG: hypothetical protein ACPLTR_01910 [Thermacetogeniaceae bacterium]
MKALVPAREVKTIQAQGAQVLETAQNLEVSLATHKRAIDLLSLIAEAKKQLETRRRAAVDPLNQKVKEINSFFRELEYPFEEADRIVRQKLIRFRAEEEQKRREEEKKLQETNIFAVVPKLATTQRAEMGQAIAHKVWEFEIEDEAQIPREYLSVDTRKIREAIKQGVRHIPGIRIFQTERLTVRRNG